MKRSTMIKEISEYFKLALSEERNDYVNFESDVYTDGSANNEGFSFDGSIHVLKGEVSYAQFRFFSEQENNPALFLVYEDGFFSLELLHDGPAISDDDFVLLEKSEDMQPCLCLVKQQLGILS